MKKLLLFTLPLLLYACSSDNETIAFLDKGLNDQVELLERKTSGFYARFEEAMQDPKTRTKIKPWFDKSARIALLRNKTFGTIQQIHILQQKDTLISYSTDTLINLINQYRQAIQEEIDDTVLVNNLILDNLQANDIQNDITNQKFAFVLNRLQTTEYEAQKYLADKCSVYEPWTKKIEAVVLPIRRYVKVGDEYEAKILVTKFRLPVYKILVNNQQLPMQGDCAIYKVTPTKKGTYYWQGAVIVQHPSSGEELQFPVKSWYVVY